MNAIMIKIRRGHGPFWGAVKDLARVVLNGHLPVFAISRPLFGLLYHLHVLAREAAIWMLRFFWYEPLFRSRCESVGTGFRMESLPYMTGHGRITIGDRVRLSGKSCFAFSNHLESSPRLDIGDDVFIGHDCRFAVADSVRIGRHCLLAGGVVIRDSDGHPLDAGARRRNRPTPVEAIKPVVVGDDVWLGTGAIVLKGVRIGDRAVVGAGAVVTADVPPDTVVAGNPARVVKRLTGAWDDRLATADK